MRYPHPFPEGKKLQWFFGPNNEVKVAGVTVRVDEDTFRVLVVELPPLRMAKDGMSPLVPDMRDIVDMRQRFFDDEAEVVVHVPKPTQGLNRVSLWQKLTGPILPAKDGLPVRRLSLGG